MNGHVCAGAECQGCERIAEARAETRTDVEKPDRWGRDADWHFPRDLAPRSPW